MKSEELVNHAINWTHVATVLAGDKNIEKAAEQREDTEKERQDKHVVPIPCNCQPIYSYGKSGTTATMLFDRPTIPTQG